MFIVTRDNVDALVEEVVGNIIESIDLLIEDDLELVEEDIEQSVREVFEGWLNLDDPEGAWDLI